jgi:flagellar protein FliS
MNQLVGAQAYAATGMESSVTAASGHQLIEMLLRSILERIVQTRSVMERGDSAEKGRLIGKMLDTLMYLQVCLDDDAGPVSEQLNETYEASMVLLTKANMDNDSETLDRVAHMISAVRDAWIEVGEQQ